MTKETLRTNRASGQLARRLGKKGGDSGTISMAETLAARPVPRLALRIDIAQFIGLGHGPFRQIHMCKRQDNHI